MSKLDELKALRDARKIAGEAQRPLNSTHETSLEKRCPYCGQNHLWPGYCQALDPVNRAQYPGIWDAAGGYSSAVNPKHLRAEMPIPHRAETETDSAESLEINDFPENGTDISVPDGANETDNGGGETGKHVQRCSECGDVFHSRRSDALYCSSACRTKAHRHRESE